MTRPRAPKGRNRDRDDRRATTDVLLGRMLRGVLTPTEAALLAQHVREEQRSADENRHAMAGTTQALARHRVAADAAIREWEQRALDAEEQLTAYRSVLGPRPLDTIRAAEQGAKRYRTAWFAARRDRRADRAAMARELPIVQAAQQALGLDALTATEAADRLAQWGATGVPAAQFVTTTEQPR
ncbi:hypothetical protein [Streptomyces sp. NBC_00199]|uniref:hypothetical protein n=1 Tax=Streptomyces sp. NBC_00199 TaxID=2975678 RepID=UPI00225C2689|nr:hypothetical protein [Streptomyces sp. NBC_00199]MCX5266068.1 hypothetical protein [Streptomyces sp. NBC_00199]